MNSEPPSSVLTLRAVNRSSGDAFYEERGQLYFVRPPLYAFPTHVDESDLARAIASHDFEPPDEKSRLHSDLASLGRHAAERLPRMSEGTFITVLSIFVKCMASDKWRRHLKTSRHDRGNPLLRHRLRTGVERLLHFPTLTPVARQELEEWQRQLWEPDIKASIRQDTFRTPERPAPDEPTVPVGKVREANVHVFARKDLPE